MTGLYPEALAAIALRRSPPTAATARTGSRIISSQAARCRVII